VVAVVTSRKPCSVVARPTVSPTKWRTSGKAFCTSRSGMEALEDSENR
jgi:hypothetical protein